MCRVANIKIRTCVQVVTLDFDYFNTESESDIVTVYDGADADAPLIASVSGSYPHPPHGYTSTGELMYVRFVSSNASTSQGFSATYKTTTTSELP